MRRYIGSKFPLKQALLTVSAVPVVEGAVAALVNAAIGATELHKDELRMT